MVLTWSGPALELDFRFYDDFDETEEIVRAGAGCIFCVRGASCADMERLGWPETVSEVGHARARPIEGG